MKYKIVDPEERRHARRTRMAAWHPWFAWHPVATIEGYRVWLETVDRRFVFDNIRLIWPLITIEYRLHQHGGQILLKSDC